MEDFIITQGDQASFLPVFGPALVVVRPGLMQASGKMTFNGKKVCVKGDEGKLSVPGCMYTAGPYVIPGVGTLKIAALAGNQTSKKTKDNGKELILKGASFTAKFEVQSPAQQVTAAGATITDAVTQYSGTGSFISTNVRLKAG